jgi:transcriptional regulator with GAF, ATPase, and Fis domain
MIVGSGPEISRLRREISRVADSDSKVLILGPTGAGKELVAQEIHRQSPRREKPLVTVNCAALTESILETELFGHRKGSFTGAYRDQKGKLKIADGGTLFLDEIGDMTLRMQGLILRFLESGEIQTVGASRTETVDVRIITATNANLGNMIVEKTFRKDLYYRLKVLQIEVPPLSKHNSDIPELIEHFVGVISNGNGHRELGFEKEALQALYRYQWPGNVRELRGFVENLLTYKDLGIVSVDDLPPEITCTVTEAKTSTATGPSFQEKPGTDLDKTVTEKMIRRMVIDGESFWEVVYQPFLERLITKEQLKEIIKFGLKRTWGHYASLCQIFNIPAHQYKKFMNFLRKHGANVDYRLYRSRR